MEQQPLETPSPNASRSPKRVVEDQSDSNPPKRLKSTSGGDDDGRPEDNCTSDNDKTITSTNPYSPPEPQPPSRTGEVLPSIEVNHEPNNEGNELLYDVMSDSILETIERNQFRPPSPRTRPATSNFERRPSSTNSPSPAPAPAPVPSPSPSRSILLAELPYGLLSPTPVSTVTASPTPPASRWVDFSPRSPFSSSYTSISEGEGDSDDEGWLDDEEWLNAAAAAAVLENADDDDEEWLDLMGQLMEEDMDDEELGFFFLWEVPQILEEWIVPVPGLGAQEVGAALVDGSGDYDGEEEDDGDEPGSTAGQNIFAPRYDSWPDFDDDSPGGQTTNYIRDDEDDSEWDVEGDALHEGPRYPGMNAFRLEGYTPAHDQPLDSGDQELEGIYITDDEDEESDGDDEDDDVWVTECKSELEAQWWGAGMRIIHYHPSMCM